MDLKISKIQKEYKKMKVSEIVPYAHNNKKHGENVVKIVESMQEFGTIAPIIVDENNEIIAGHGRREALIRLGQEEVDVLWVSGLSEKQKRDYRLRDNKLTELSDRDFDAIKFELDELQIPELTDLFDFQEMEAIAKIKEELPSADEFGDDFELPSGDKSVIETMTFTVHRDQKAQIDEAISIAKSMGSFGNTGNENSNGNALARVCETFITQNQ